MHFSIVQQKAEEEQNYRKRRRIVDNSINNV